jgi:flavin reductase
MSLTTNNSAGAQVDTRLKLVLRHLPAPVSVVSSFDPETGNPIGLAMSAIMAMSLDPCSMAIAISRSAASFDAIVHAEKFCINLLDPERQRHLETFANIEARNRRFTQPDWQRLGEVWFIEGAPANIFCKIAQRTSFGTHDLLIGEVYELHTSGRGDILGWANGRAGRLAPLDSCSV